jgi:NAD(P)-dependent dehydrogenase (short-subunit alcohol dehydrogenase family)
MQLADRVAVVTGAGTGIGRATALQLAAAGAAGVVIVYRSSDREAEMTAAEVRRMGCTALCVQSDVRDDAQVRGMVRSVGDYFGRLDVLVNNAGSTHWVPLTDLDALTDEMWDDVLDVNLVGAYRCVRAAAPLLRATHGAVINVASVSGILAASTTSSLAYGAAKAGLMYLTRGLAVALAPDVRVNAVAPAFTDTRWMRDHFAETYDERIERAATSIPLGRVATPDDVAAAIVGLITGSDFVTGQTLVIDGGLSLS